MCIPTQTKHFDPKIAVPICLFGSVEYQNNHDLSKKNPVCLLATLIHPCSLENSFQIWTLVVKLPVNGYFKMRLHKVFDPFMHVASRCAFLAERKEKFSALSFKLDSCSSSSNKQQSFFSLSLKANSLSCLISHSFPYHYCQLKGIQPA